ncbi:MAG: hypothetical protein J6S70_02175, partial [Clostridia bacterium]|nr:hypothetical protein [Clostridia bacterium]
MKEESKVPASDAQSKLRRVLAIIAVAAVILALCELTFASRKSLALGFKDAVRVDIPVDRLNVKNGVILNGGLKMQGNTVIKIPLQGVKIEYIALKFVEKPALIEVSVLAKDAAWRDSLRPYHNQRVYAGSGEAVIDYDSAGGVTTLELDFDQGAKGVVLTGIILNYAFGLHFNFLRWLLVFLVFCAAVFIKEYKPYAKTLDLAGHGAKALVCAACALCSVFALIGAVKNCRPEKYPFEKPVKEYSCYQQQTDALLKGRLDLDIEFSAGELASLKNPYDAGVRQTETSSYSALWDRAYVSETGKVYSYFGIAPVLLFYLPLTALTGYMPGDGAANLFFTLCAVAAFAAALSALLRYFKIRTDPVTLCFALCAVVCGSSVFVLNVHPTIPWLLAVMACQVAVLIWMYSRGPYLFQNTQLFSPLLYADGPFLYSLGAVVIINLGINLLVLDLYLVRWTLLKRIRRRQSRPLELVLALLIGLMFIGVAVYLHISFR